MLKNWCSVSLSALFFVGQLLIASTLEVVDVKGPENGCVCKDVDIVSNRDIVLRKHGDVLGRYTRIEGIQGGLGTPSYVHYSGKFFLYYSEQSQVRFTFFLIVGNF